MAVRIILVGTTHPGNIGAAARAMKNMGLRDLVLVNPRYFPHEDATARASGAEDILESARVVDSLDKALADCVYAAGASARSRDDRLALHGAERMCRRDSSRKRRREM